MNLYKGMSSIVMTGLISAVMSTQGYAGTMGTPIAAPGKFYAGVFGGGGASDDFTIAQYATAFLLEAEGGPLAVDSFGTTSSRTVGFIGGQVGYQWAALPFSYFSYLSGFSPAVELEGYYAGRKRLTVDLANNESLRLEEHDFVGIYPQDAGVFIASGVMNLNLSSMGFVHPYVGAGIGGAVLSIINASSVQINPPEFGVNHYSHNNDKTSTFAGQVKAGLNVDISENINVFAEYRWLYLASTSYTFGSTISPGHAVTSSWTVKMGPQSYNLGAVGLRFSI